MNLKLQLKNDLEPSNPLPRPKTFLDLVPNNVKGKLKFVFNSTDFNRRLQNAVARTTLNLGSDQDNLSNGFPLEMIRNGSLSADSIQAIAQDQLSEFANNIVIDNNNGLQTIRLEVSDAN